MSAQQTFRLAWHELRCALRDSGFVAYTKLNAPRMRMAAIECHRMRLYGDTEMAAIRRRRARVEFDIGLREAFR